MTEKTRSRLLLMPLYHPVGARPSAPGGRTAHRLRTTHNAGSVLRLTAGCRVVMCDSSRARPTRNGQSVRGATRDAAHDCDRPPGDLRFVRETAVSCWSIG